MSYKESIDRMKNTIPLMLLISCAQATYGMAEKDDHMKNIYGFADSIGRRPSMEDEMDVHIDSDYSFFAVFDGHNGRSVATIAKTRLRQECKLEDAKTDEEIEFALRNGFLKTNESIEEDKKNVGSTATVAVIKNGKIFVVNAGDSRTVLSTAGKATPLSSDHKPNRLDEMRRILLSGGTVTHICGAWRVQNSLSVSRALGDKSLNPYVIAEPEVTLTPLADTHEFLILACDGVWDVMDDQGAVNEVKRSLAASEDYHNAAQKLVESAYQKGSEDNISIIIVNLKSFIKK